MRLITVIDAAGTSRQFKASRWTEDEGRLTLYRGDAEPGQPIALFAPNAWQAVFDEEETT